MRIIKTLLTLAAICVSIFASNGQIARDVGQSLIISNDLATKAAAAGKAAAEGAAEGVTVMTSSGLETGGGASIFGQIYSYIQDAVNGAQQIATMTEGVKSSIEMEESFRKYYSLANSVVGNWGALTDVYSAYYEHIDLAGSLADEYTRMFENGELTWNEAARALSRVATSVRLLENDWDLITDKEDGLFSRAAWSPEFRLEFVHNLIDKIRSQTANMKDENKEIKETLALKEAGQDMNALLESAFSLWRAYNQKNQKNPSTTTSSGKKSASESKREAISSQETANEVKKNVYDAMEKDSKEQETIKEAEKNMKSTEASDKTKKITNIILMIEALLAMFFAIPAFIRINKGERQGNDSMLKLLAGSLAMFVLTIIIGKIIIPNIYFF